MDFSHSTDFINVTYISAEDREYNDTYYYDKFFETSGKNWEWDIKFSQIKFFKNINLFYVSYNIYVNLILYRKYFYFNIFFL